MHFNIEHIKNHLDHISNITYAMLQLTPVQLSKTLLQHLEQRVSPGSQLSLHITNFFKKNLLQCSGCQYNTEKFATLKTDLDRSMTLHNFAYSLNTGICPAINVIFHDTLYCKVIVGVNL